MSQNDKADVKDFLLQDDVMDITMYYLLILLILGLSNCKSNLIYYENSKVDIN